MNVKSKLLLLFFFFSCLLVTESLYAQETKAIHISFNQQIYQLYPQILDELPVISSPFTTKDGCDNRLVHKLGLTHPQMAKPLFQVWNIILKEIELGNWSRFWNNIRHIIYNGRKVILKAGGGKGWQISIFQDEIKGRFNINVHRLNVQCPI